MFGRKKQYSYIKKSFAKNGWVCLVLTLIAFLITEGLLVFSVLRRGDVSELSSLLAIWAILLDLSGMGFGLAGLREKEKNYSIIIVCFIVGIIILFQWLLIVR